VPTLAPPSHLPRGRRAKGDVKVQLNDGVLTITGERDEQKTQEEVRAARRAGGGQMQRSSGGARGRRRLAPSPAGPRRGGSGVEGRCRAAQESDGLPRQAVPRDPTPPTPFALTRLASSHAPTQPNPFSPPPPPPTPTVQEGKVRWVERSHGRFVRSFALPDNADGDAISATLEDGVLRVAIAKRPEAKPAAKEIAVE
jgi:HSP20 family molecular chaperone IbpA